MPNAAVFGRFCVLRAADGSLLCRFSLLTLGLSGVSATWIPAAVNRESAVLPTFPTF